MSYFKITVLVIDQLLKLGMLLFLFVLIKSHVRP